MKNKDKLLSSMIIALVAGFIYYQFSDSEVVKKIPQLAYRLLVPSGHESTFDSGNEKENNKSEKKTFSSTTENNYPSENTEIANPAYGGESILNRLNAYSRDFAFGNLVRIPDFLPEKVYFDRDQFGADMKHLDKSVEEIEIPLEKLGININRDIFVYTASNYGFNPDSLRYKIKIPDMDSFSVNLDNAMKKLNFAMEKLTAELNDKNFEVIVPDDEIPDLPELPEIDAKEQENLNELGKIKEFDMKEFKEGMKEFEKEMQNFKFEMKDYQENMKKFKEDLKEMKRKINTDVKKMKEEEYIRKIEETQKSVES